MVTQLGLEVVAALGVSLRGDEGEDGLPGVLVGHGDHGRLGNALVADQRRLDLHG